MSQNACPNSTVATVRILIYATSMEMKNTSTIIHSRSRTSQRVSHKTLAGCFCHSSAPYTQMQAHKNTAGVPKVSSSITVPRNAQSPCNSDCSMPGNVSGENTPVICIVTKGRLYTKNISISAADAHANGSRNGSFSTRTKWWWQRGHSARCPWRSLGMRVRRPHSGQSMVCAGSVAEGI